MNHRALLGILTAFLVMGALLALIRLTSSEVTGLVFSTDLLVRVSATAGLMALTYCLAIILWHRFLLLFGEKRSWSETTLDIGLLSVGKYFPGKIVGLLARGAIQGNASAVSASSAALSILEQLVSLIVGCITGLCLFGAALIFNEPKQLAIFALGYLVLAALCLKIFLRLVHRVPFIAKKLDKRLTTIPYSTACWLGLGYGLTWALTAFSLAPLVETVLAPGETLLLLSVFLISIVAGWLAIFAPAGIGVREAVFTALAAPVVPWQQALLWISLHRLICCGLDIFFGAICLFFSSLRLRKPCRK